ncbi:MAG TPA: hypothetical protein VEL47_07105 [Myxococcota bacterium]|nr:hypothetical protein [Myxococcota bacterium]
MACRIIFLAVFFWCYHSFCSALDTEFGSLEEAKAAGLENREPNFVNDWSLALGNNKLVPFQEVNHIQAPREMLLFLLTMRSYNSLIQITAMNTSLLFFMKDQKKLDSVRLKMPTASYYQASYKDSLAKKNAPLPMVIDEDNDNCCECCCFSFKKQTQRDPSIVAQETALAAGLLRATWGPGWDYDAAWGPSWDSANKELTTFYQIAQAIGFAQIKRALVGITDPEQQGRIAYRVAEWVALNTFYDKASQMLDIAYKSVAKNLPADAKNPFSSLREWQSYRDTYFTVLKKESQIFLSPWIKIFDQGQLSLE